MSNPTRAQLLKIEEILQKELEQARFEEESDGQMFCSDSNGMFDLPAIMKEIEKALR